MDLIVYPAHAIDAFLVTTERGLTLLKVVCDKYGRDDLANSWSFGKDIEKPHFDETKHSWIYDPEAHEKETKATLQLQETPEYEAWVKENIDMTVQYRKILKEYRGDDPDDSDEWSIPPFLDKTPQLCVYGTNLDRILLPTEYHAFIKHTERPDLVCGIDLADRELSNWQHGAIDWFLRTDLEINVRGAEDLEHKYWLSFVGD